MCIDIHTDMCISMCIDMCMDEYRHIYGHEHKHMPGSVASGSGVGGLAVDFDSATKHSGDTCTCHTLAKSEAMQALIGLKKTLGFKLVTTDTQGVQTCV